MPQEFSITNDGANETIVVKKRLRVSSVNIRRGGSITFSTERVHIDNTTDQDRIVNSGPQVVRPVESILSETVILGGQPVALLTLLNGLGKFFDKWRAEDVAAQNP